ncbi:hypothetical protein LOAG_07926 [Loa loa]|nr:hypothetical protein LOAG_07926 [Loa loa]EFO20566.1 hypothetical protein LOAG_07926 [Loa loa]
MEFELCHKDPKEKQYFFLSSVLVSEEGMEMNGHISNNTIDFDYIFYGYPVPKIPASEKPQRKRIQLHMRLRNFIPFTFTGAISYAGSFFQGDCREGVTYLIFDTPIAIKPGLHLTVFYSNSINLTRPIQDERQVRYYMSSNIEFTEGDYEGSKFCSNFNTQISDNASASVNLGMKFSRPIQIID